MKRFAIIIFSALFLLIAYVSKPNDKKCIKESVKAVWGAYTPDPNLPMYYEQFMNTTSRSVVINDWIVLKQIKYRFAGGAKTIGIGAFNKVFIF